MGEEEKKQNEEGKKGQNQKRSLINSTRKFRCWAIDNWLRFKNHSFQADTVTSIDGQIYETIMQRFVEGSQAF